jgi:TFIIF-interacting CTD phosphatase-like protein
MQSSSWTSSAMHSRSSEDIMDPTGRSSGDRSSRGYERRTSSSSVEKITPESRQLKHVPYVRGLIGLGVRDEVRQEHPQRDAPAHIIGNTL